ncbi:MAG: ImuA family protein [Pseudomonadota bacterium]
MPVIEAGRLTRGAAAGPRLELGAGAALPLGRAHEVCGPSRAAFAAMAAGLLGARDGPGPVLWIRGPKAEGRLNPDGLAAFFEPGRLVLAAPRREADLLWCAEEALRSGAAALVVAELPGPPRLTPVRRLHLAAEAGGEGRAAPPVALLLTPAGGGAEGVETRWRLAPAPTEAEPWTDGGPPAWRLELLRARLAPPRAWRAVWRRGAAGGPLHLTPEGAPEAAA